VVAFVLAITLAHRKDGYENSCCLLESRNTLCHFDGAGNGSDDRGKTTERLGYYSLRAELPLAVAILYRYLS
jgi:hypothetical protein